MKLMITSSMRNVMAEPYTTALTEDFALYKDSTIYSKSNPVYSINLIDNIQTHD